MLLKALFAAVLALCTTAAAAGPKEDAEALVNRFIQAFNTAKGADEIVALFAPDAQFWGTVSPDLALSPEPIQKYFAASLARRATAPSTASVVDSSIVIPSPNVALVSGRWKVESAVNVANLRFSAVLVQRDGRWLISQFHSSPRPQAK